QVIRPARFRVNLDQILNDVDYGIVLPSLQVLVGLPRRGRHLAAFGDHLFQAFVDSLDELFASHFGGLADEDGNCSGGRRGNTKIREDGGRAQLGGHLYLRTHFSAQERRQDLSKPTPYFGPERHQDLSKPTPYVHPSASPGPDGRVLPASSEIREATSRRSCGHSGVHCSGNYKRALPSIPVARARDSFRPSIRAFPWLRGRKWANLPEVAPESGNPA